MFAALGDALDDYSAGDTLANAYTQDPALAQLHQLALLIAELRSEANQQLNAVSNADDNSFDPNILSTLLGQIQQYTTSFAALRRTINAQTLQQNDVSPIDNAMRDLSAWAHGIAGFLQQAGNTIANLPTTAANYLAQQAANIAAAAAAAAKAAADAAWKVAEPFVFGGVALLVGLLLFTRQAETTRTYRKYVA